MLSVPKNLAFLHLNLEEILPAGADRARISLSVKTNQNSQSKTQRNLLNQEACERPET